MVKSYACVAVRLVTCKAMATLQDLPANHGEHLGKGLIHWVSTSDGGCPTNRDTLRDRTLLHSDWMK